MLGLIASVGRPLQRGARILVLLPLMLAVGARADNPELLDESGAVSPYLSISEADVDIHLFGRYAQTTITLTIKSSAENWIEGVVHFRMPEGSVLNGYALDIEDTLVPGVVLEKEQAQAVYEDKIRDTVDPGLARQDDANLFNTRIYPFEAGGERQLRFRYVTWLGTSGAYSLPFERQDQIGSLSVRVHGSLSGKRPKVSLPKGLEGDWEVGAQGLSGEFEGEDIAIKQALIVAVPAALKGRSSLSIAADGMRYFELWQPIPSGGFGRAKRPRTLRLYWDTSLSRKDQSPDKVFAVIADLIDQAGIDAVELVPFSSEMGDVRSYRGAQLGRLRADIRALSYGGASDFASLGAPLGRADLCLLVSDGRPTLVTAAPALPACRLHSLVDSDSAGIGYLQDLTSRTGGAVHDVRSRASSSIVASLMSVSTQYVGTETDGAEVYRLPAPAGWVRLVGRMTGDSAKGALLFDRNTGRSVRRTFHIKGEGQAFDGLRALWATAKIAQMRQAAEPDRNGIIAVSTQYGVPTDETSFLVLEAMEDYVDAGLTPPESLPDYDAEELVELLQGRAEEEAEARERHVKDVVERWQDLKDWWQKDFDLSPENIKAIKDQIANGGLRSRPGRHYAPMAMPPADESDFAGGPEYEFEGGDGVEEVIVTGTRRALEAPFTIAPWQSDRPYILALQPLTGAAFDREFGRQRAEHGTLPAFYFDVADLLFSRGDGKAAALMALNVLDLSLKSGATEVILADKLGKYGDLTRALVLYEKLAKDFAFLPQPRRMLALALAQKAKLEADDTEKRALYARALDLLHKVVMTPWKIDYDGAEMVSLVDANHIMAALRKLGDNGTPFAPELVSLLDVDLRVVIGWNTDASDMDLWVEEPTGQKAFYADRFTAIGGHMSDDMTGGYGPEEYLLHKAADGKYRFFVHYFRSDSLRVDGPITVRVDLFRNYGRGNEVHQRTDVELAQQQGDEAWVGEIVLGDPAPDEN